MAAVRRLPVGLFGRQALDGSIDRNEPFGFVVSGAQLVQQEASQRSRLWLSLSRQRKCWQYDEQWKKGKARFQNEFSV